VGDGLAPDFGLELLAMTRPCLAPPQLSATLTALSGSSLPKAR
jgi:hypothetical protein